MTKRFGSILIMIAGVLWGCMGLFVRRLNAAGLESMQIVQLRALVACAVLFLILLIRDRRLLILRVKDLWCFLGTGICSIVFFNFCYFKAIEIASLSVAAVLLYTAPIWVMLFSGFLFGEKFSVRKAAALVQTVVGCALVTGITNQTGATSGLGILAGLGAGLGYALYSIFGRYALERGYSSWTITFYTFLIALIGSLFLTDIREVIPTAFGSGAIAAVSVGLGIVCTVMPFLLYTLGLSGVENSKASITASVEPVTATLLGVYVYGEGMTIGSCTGIVLVVAALVFCSGGEKRDMEPAQ